MKHFLNLMPHSPEFLGEILDHADTLKAAHAIRAENRTLTGRVVGMVFEKPSLRTRVSFEAGVAQLGGATVFLPGHEVGMGVRESLADFARTMSQYVDAIVLRVFKQTTIEGVAEAATVPVVNGLSDLAHPCQAMADLMTLRECFGTFKDKHVVFVGDGNNVARSLAVACGKFGVKFTLARPEGYGFDGEFMSRFRKHVPGPMPMETSNTKLAVRDADVIYTDVWTSMGQEAEREARLKLFAPFQVNAELLAAAPKTCKVMHCLPAHRDEEITHEVIESGQSVVFAEAANRMHVQKAILERLILS